jgi:molecular chaperone GrpE
MGKQSTMNDDDNGIDQDSDGGELGQHAAGRRRRTRAEAMGIGPDLPRKGDPEAMTTAAGRDVKKQIEAAEQEVEAARSESRESAERYVRLAAEMDNVRRRHRQEQADQLQYANAELIAKLLPVLDNFHRALDHAELEGSGDQLRNGLLMVVKQFEDILESEGVRVIETEGKFFDPNLHQAVIAEPSVDHEEGQVLAELQRGYTQHDRVLRPSLVKVARNS